MGLSTIIHAFCHSIRSLTEPHIINVITQILANFLAAPHVSAVHNCQLFFSPCLSWPFKSSPSLGVPVQCCSGDIWRFSQGVSIPSAFLLANLGSYWLVLFLHTEVHCDYLLPANIQNLAYAKDWSFSMFALVVLHYSHLYNNVDLTLVLKILSLTSVEVGDVQIFISCWWILAFLSSSVPPFGLYTLYIISMVFVLVIFIINPSFEANSVYLSVSPCQWSKVWE